MASRSVRFFPEINDEQSSGTDLSPLKEIIQELKRKNVVTASAFSGSRIALLDTGDPWGNIEPPQEDSPPAPHGNSRMRRRTTSLFGREFPTPKGSFGHPSPQRSSAFPRQPMTRESSVFSEVNFDAPDGTGPNFPYQKEGSGALEGMDGMPSRSPRQRRLAAWLESTRKESQHDKALLLATPELRIISQSSSDMQAVVGASSNGFLGFLLSNSSSNGSGLDGRRRSGGCMSEYQASLARGSANEQAAAELSSLLWIMAHEMSLEDYGTVENEVFTSVFALVHSQDNKRRMAGLSALDALIDAPSSDEEKKAIKFANTLSNGLRSAHGDYEFLSAVSKALGHMARRTVNIDFVEAEVVRALEWLRTDRSDRR